MENKNFCIRPFNSLFVSTSGSMRSCCKIKHRLSLFKGKSNFNIKSNAIEDFWQSDYLKYLQKSFLENKKPNECGACWKAETQGIKSLRQSTNVEYKIVGNKEPIDYLNLLGKYGLEHPEDYNLDITNLCNLKCYMCTGSSSSKLLIENNDLGIEQLDQKDYDYTEDRLNYLIQQIVEKDVSLITLQGGEPLMNPKIILLLEKLSAGDKAKNLTVWITTNGTMYEEKIFHILKSFKTVKIIFSIDGTDKVNDYLRFPSQFDVISKNVKAFKKLPNSSFMINFVIQNFNLLYIKNIIDFSYQNDIHCKLSVLEQPAYLHFSVLPINTREKAFDRLKEIDDATLTNVTNFVSFKKLLEQNLKIDTSSQLEKFVKIIQMRDRYRKIKLANYIPELATDLGL